MMAIIFGLIFMVLGIWGVVAWWPYFINIMKGLFPMMFTVGGLIAIIAGVAGIKDTSEEKIEKEIEQK
jgi:hypothetical protein